MKAPTRANGIRVPIMDRRSHGAESLAGPGESRQPIEKGPPQPPTFGRWILVADDEKALRLLLVRVLTDAGYTVVAARDGVEALELARQVFPHLIILDLRMPRRSGLEVLAHVRQVPVIILSGYLRDLPPEIASRSNVVAMLEKPVTLDELRSTVRDALSRWESRGQTNGGRASR
jgi:CheY-like chemotaxis protein